MVEQFLSMRNISKRYIGVQALDSVDFEVNRGEIHCLVGENGSGKSTLIKIISGVVQPDDGAHIVIDGEEFHDYAAIDAIRKGIEVIYQDLSLFPNLTVAENIALSRTIAKGRTFINWSRVRQVAQEAIDRIEVSLPLDDLVGDISLGDQQLVAICRALTHDVRLVIMDEPTSALTRKEVQALFAVVKDLQAKGIATMFVSHKLNEVFEIAERVTVLRDGLKVGTFASRELDDERLTMLMTGKKLEQRGYRPQEQNGDVLLETRNLARRGSFVDISFKLYSGDILGITGLLGSGRTELALALFGLRPADSGEILLGGEPVRVRSVQDAKRLGIGYVPENRLVQGLIMEQPVGKNIIITVLHKLLNRLGLIDLPKMRSWIDEGVRSLAIKVPSVEAPVETLSGGNQQRVVLAKWVSTDPRILILDGPTVGVDVAAKSAIHNIIRRLAEQGIGVITISDEISEVLQNCNRVVVMHKGRFLAEFEPARTTEDEIQVFINQAR
jgi:simple sugar transport system ATP-binding protein